MDANGVEIPGYIEQMKAMTLGYQAKDAGRSTHANPFDDATLRHAWTEGWATASLQPKANWKGRLVIALTGLLRK